MRHPFLLGVFACLGPAIPGAFAQAVPAQLPDFTRTPAQWAATAAGAGSKVTLVTLLGDPSRPGPYAQLLEVPPHARIAAHHHDGDRISTVLKGTWHFGYGPRFDAAALTTLPTGSVYTEPSDTPHYGMAGDDAVVVLVTGTGPTSTVYEAIEQPPPRKP